MRFHAALRSASVTPCTWLKRAAALRTWVAFSKGSLRCLGNANLVAGIRSRTDSVSFAISFLPSEYLLRATAMRTGLAGRLDAARRSRGWMVTEFGWGYSRRR